MAHHLQPRAHVLEVFVVLGMMLFPVWVTLTFWWWMRLAPPPLLLARVYMTVGGLWSIGSCAQLLVVPVHGGTAHFLIQQHLGAMVLLAALYAEIFVRWMHVRHRVDHLAPAWIVRVSGRRRAPPRFLAGP